MQESTSSLAWLVINWWLSARKAEPAEPVAREDSSCEKCLAKCETAELLNECNMMHMMHTA